MTYNIHFEEDFASIFPVEDDWHYTLGEAILIVEEYLNNE